MESGFPLGLVPGAEYPETHFRMNSGDKLTLLSDGVVEARNPAGELFGFERTAAISSKTADQIAKTAELFGQEDDITVLTLTRLAELALTLALKPIPASETTPGQASRSLPNPASKFFSAQTKQKQMLISLSTLY